MTLIDLVKKFWTPAFFRYLLVGGFGFLLDAGGTEVLYHLGLDVHAARALAMTGAIGCTYLFHRYYTFTDSKKPQRTGAQFIAFGAVQLTAAALNYAIFCVILWFQPKIMPVPLPGAWQDLFNIFAIGAGVGAGLVFNFLLLRLFVFQVAANDEGPIETYIETPDERRARMKRLYWQAGAWAVFLVTIGWFALTRQTQVLSFPHLKEPLPPPDPDVWMRLNGVRQWLTGGDFFSHAVKGTNAPIGQVTTPWTRPLDALLSLFYFFTPVKLGENIRLMLAATWLPPFLSAIALALMAAAAKQVFRSGHVFICAALLWLMNTDLYDYFAPGDSDHHGLLCTLWCGVLLLMVRREATLAAAGAMGVLLGIMVWISPEALILTALVFALLGGEGMLYPARMQRLAAAAVGAAMTANTALYIEVPPQEFATRLTYDSLSIVQVSLLWLTAAGACGLAAFYRQPLSFAARFCAASIAGAFVLLGMYALYPRFFLGPLADVDPFIFTGFLPHISEATPLFKDNWEDIIRQTAQPLLAVILLGIALARRNLRPERQRQLILLALPLAVTFIMVLAQIRWDYYLQPVVIIAASALLPGLLGAMGKKLRWLPRRARPYLCLWALFMVVQVGVRLHPVKMSESGGCMVQLRYIIQTQQLQKKLGDADLIIYTPADVGGDMLFFTPYRIIASNYHREGPGLKDLNLLETASNPGVAHDVLSRRKAAAMFYCPSRLPKDSWLRQASEAGKYPAWMTPVAGLSFMEKPGPLPVLAKVKN